jgi:hypothetical protein
MNCSENLSLVITVKSSKLLTMRRLLPLVLLVASSAVLAESGAYRVEVIVFRNLSATVQSTEVAELRNFSQFPALEVSGQPGDLTAPKSDQAAGGLAGALPNNLAGDLPVDLPDDLFVVTEKSSQMDNAWRRLRSSNNYRPLVYAAWEQNRVDYYPPMRIHNQQIIASRLNPPTRIMVADLTAADPLAAYRSVFYQLDGSLQLRRSRFLHVDLDLEIREERFRDNTQAALLPGNGIQAATTGMANEPVGFGVYALNQNRQVTTGRMAYFDTPYFGALVYVTSIKASPRVNMASVTD